mgnify:CR=1 FL=1
MNPPSFFTLGIQIFAKKKQNRITLHTKIEATLSKCLLTQLIRMQCYDPGFDTVMGHFFSYIVTGNIYIFLEKLGLFDSTSR